MISPIPSCGQRTYTNTGVSEFCDFMASVYSITRLQPCCELFCEHCHLAKCMCTRMLSSGTLMVPHVSHPSYPPGLDYDTCSPFREQQQLTGKEANKQTNKQDCHNRVISRFPYLTPSLPIKVIHYATLDSEKEPGFINRNIM